MWHLSWFHRFAYLEAMMEQEMEDPNDMSFPVCLLNTMDSQGVRKKEVCDLVSLFNLHFVF